VVIERLVGVRFHPGHVWRLLRRLDWSVQRPTRRALERDEAEITRWRAQEWPRIKGGRLSGTRGSASWTSPASRCDHRSGAPGRHAGRPHRAPPRPLEAGVHGRDLLLRA
jgi:hypothetical protein